MPKVGNKRKIYITTSEYASFAWLTGEQSNNFNRSANVIEVTDKDIEWAKFLAGKKSATASAALNLDNSATSEQHALLKSLHKNQSVFCFIGELSNNEPAEGDAFEAIITAINDDNPQDAVASRNVDLQVTGEPVHYPSLEDQAPAQDAQPSAAPAQVQGDGNEQGSGEAEGGGE